MFPLQKISVPVCFAILSATAFAGDPHFMPAGAGQAGMAYVCVMKADFWSAFHNQALLAHRRGVVFGANYENRFGIPELGTCTSAISLPAGRTSIGVIYSHFGYRDYNRQMAGLGCGLPVSENLSAGIQLDYFTERTYGEYAGHQAVTFEAGLILSVNKNLKIGVHLFNPVPGSIRKRDMVSSLRTGAGAVLGKGLFAGTELEITSGGSVDLRSGFEYELSKSFWLRGGLGHSILRSPSDSATKSNPP